MQKTFLYSVITLVCASSYAHVFQLGQIEVIADNSSDLTTTRLEYQALEKNNITNVAKVAKITPGVSFERIGARSEQNINVRGFDARRVPIDDGSEDWKVTRLNVDTKHNFNGAVHALNADGSVAVGYTQVSPNVKQNQAVLWKNNGQDKGRSENWHYTYLKSLTNYTSDQHDAGSSFAYALNAQGNIIGGTAAIDQGCATTDRPDDNCVSRPVIWYDSTQKPVALSTLKTEGIGEGAIYGLNHDGTIAVGVSETDLTDDFNRPIQKATVWKLDYTQAIPKVSDPVSIQDTRETMGRLGTRALATISSQNRLLSSLTESF
ncbi:TPA: autotransporter domain-containing protein, partial [Pasteurella multocida]